MTTASASASALDSVDARDLADAILGGDRVYATLQAVALRMAEKLSAIGYSCSAPDDELTLTEHSASRGWVVGMDIWDLSLETSWRAQIEFGVFTDPSMIGVADVSARILGAPRKVDGNPSEVFSEEFFRCTSRPGTFDSPSEQTLEGWTRHVLRVFYAWSDNELKNGDPDLVQFADEFDQEMRP